MDPPETPKIQRCGVLAMCRFIIVGCGGNVCDDHEDAAAAVAAAAAAAINHEAYGLILQRISCISGDSSHVTRHTSHVTRHTSHVTRHMDVQCS